MTQSERFYILDTRGPISDCALFWRPDGAGYTADLAEAGLYPWKEPCRPTDVFVSQELAERLAVRRVPFRALLAALNRGERS